MQAEVSNNIVRIPGKDTGNGAPLIATWDVERMTFQDINFTSNAAELLIYFKGYGFKNAIRNVPMIANNASGIFFEGAGPRFSWDGVTLDGVVAQWNVLQTLHLKDKVPNGVLSFKGITSNAGESYNVTISNSTIAHNWAREAVTKEVRRCF